MERLWPGERPRGWIDGTGFCSYFVPVMIETLGEAYSLGVRVTMRCAWGKRAGLKTIRECQYTKELELEFGDLHARGGVPVVRARRPPEMPALWIAQGGVDLFVSGQ